VPLQTLVRLVEEEEGGVFGPKEIAVMATAFDRLLADFKLVTAWRRSTEIGRAGGQNGGELVVGPVLVLSDTFRAASCRRISRHGGLGAGGRAPALGRYFTFEHQPSQSFTDAAIVLRLREVVHSPSVRSAFERGSDTFSAFELREVARALFSIIRKLTARP
jgi:hypothetical protein